MSELCGMWIISQQSCTEKKKQKKKHLIWIKMDTLLRLYTNALVYYPLTFSSWFKISAMCIVFSILYNMATFSVL